MNYLKISSILRDGKVFDFHPPMLLMEGNAVVFMDGNIYCLDMKGFKEENNGISDEEAYRLQSLLEKGVRSGRILPS
jgi:hypothetical protein